MITIDKIQYLQLGVQGDNNTADIQIDMTPWADVYEGATFHVLYKPYNASEVSPMLCEYDSETKVLSWTVTLSATAVAGVGYTEIRAQNDDGLVKKSRIIPTSVENSVTGVETEPPATYQPWVDQVLAVGVQAQTAASNAAESAQQAAQTVAGIDAAGAAQVQAVNTAGAAQVQAVNTAGAAQVQAVNTAGAAQTQSVEDKGTEVLASIPEDYSSLTDEVDSLNSALNNATENLVANATTLGSGLYINTDGTLVTGALSDRTIVVEAEANKTYRIKKSTSTIMRVGCGSSASLTSGDSLSDYSGHDSASSDALYVGTDSTNHFIYVQLFANSDSASLQSVSANTATLVICENVPEELSELQSAIDTINDHLTEINVINVSSLETRQGLINIHDKWSTSSGFYSYALSVGAGEYKSISITAGADKATLGLLASSTLTNNTAPTYATGAARTVVPAGTSATFDIPDDCVYIVITKAGDGRDYTPSAISLACYKKIVEIDDTLTMSGEAADAKATGDAINNIYNAVTETETVDIGSATVIRGLINTSNVWSMSSGFYSYAFSLGDGYTTITITANANNNASIGLLKNSTLSNSDTPPYCDGITGRIIVPAGTTATYDIPSDCTYITIAKTGNTNDYTPASIVFRKWGISSSEAIPLGLHEMPRNESALNIVKRCRQMTDIKWTPAVDLPRFMLVQRLDVPDTATSQNYLGTFKAGTEYTGVPYGRVSDTMDEYGIDYATVGHYIGFDTFVSSVSNPSSKLCAENVGSVSGHRSVIYATVCSGMACYALNVDERATASIPSISGLTLIGKLNDEGVLLSDDNFKIGDILNKYDYHVAIITDIIRNTDGEIVTVELSDASTAGLADRNYANGQIGGICRRKGWTREQLFNVANWGDYSLYRYTGNVPYTPSQYVNVGDEFDGWRIEHFPVMPYEGENFAYTTGSIPNNAVKLVVVLSGYAYLRVFKDGTEITGSPFSVTDETTSVDISVIDAGSYEAYLCNIEDGDVVNLTYPCHWTIA